MDQEVKTSSKPEYVQGIIQYYSEAGMDYQPWSRRLNMHFGYFRFGLNPFNRESLLDEMSRQVVTRLQLDHDAENQLVDLGCGVGASARYAVEHYPHLKVLGATIVPWQIEQAQRLTENHAHRDQLSFELMDYCNLPVADDHFDGAYAMESSCYDMGKEFAYHRQISEALDVDGYFAHPYHSWQRGLNENHNGLIRQYLPKGMALNEITRKEIRIIQDKLNNRPRKTLGYKTANEVYEEMKLAS